MRIKRDGPARSALIVLAAGREMKLLSEVSLGSTPYATPVAANGSLFIGSQNYLWCVQKGAKALPGPMASGK